MKKITPALIAFIIILPLLSIGQTLDKTANEAFMITRMVNKFHVEPRTVNDAFSQDVFTGMLNKTDEDRLFFTKGDIGKLNAYRTRLDDEITHRKTAYLSLFINTYKQ